ncbi:Hypothetical predicted protein [Mytilus galloprovincialis]|uniref:Uncharacterized protein n=1 Tax=Mytilus galloprovincialis TaxID=29158 RepID=A0A8B6GEU9_MYTGA|nr:Hypothetical predicted protein [Mytilus galloprovincialis]
MDIQTLESISFKVKACDGVFLSLVDYSFGTLYDNNIVYRVLFGKAQIKIIENQSEITLAYETWSGIDCNCYVSVVVSWANAYITIEARKECTADLTTNVDVTLTAQELDSTTTSKTAQFVETTAFSPNKTPCTCLCNNFTISDDELIRKIALLRSELSIDTKRTNKYRRSLISAADDRPSSKYIGNFGIVVLVVICSLIVLMDFQHYTHVIFQKHKNLSTSC